MTSTYIFLPFFQILDMRKELKGKTQLRKDFSARVTCDLEQKAWTSLDHLGSPQCCLVTNTVPYTYTAQMLKGKWLLILSFQETGCQKIPRCRSSQRMNEEKFSETFLFRFIAKCEFVNFGLNFISMTLHKTTIKTT